MQLKDIVMIVFIILVAYYYYNHSEEVNANVKSMFNTEATEEYKVGWNTAAGWNAVTTGNTEHMSGGLQNPASSYEDYLLESHITDDVVRSHREFVKDRTQYDSATGPLKKLAMEPQESVPWMGLRRPRGVDVDPNSAQVHDVDMDAYTGSSLRY